jgi:hypothetical protein
MNDFERFVMKPPKGVLARIIAWEERANPKSMPEVLQNPNAAIKNVLVSACIDELLANDDSHLSHEDELAKSESTSFNPFRLSDPPQGAGSLATQKVEDKTHSPLLKLSKNFVYFCVKITDTALLTPDDVALGKYRISASPIKKHKQGREAARAELCIYNEQEAVDLGFKAVISARVPGDAVVVEYVGISIDQGTVTFVKRSKKIYDFVTKSNRKESTRQNSSPFDGSSSSVSGPDFDPERYRVTEIGSGKLSSQGVVFRRPQLQNRKYSEAKSKGKVTSAESDYGSSRVFAR